MEKMLITVKIRRKNKMDKLYFITGSQELYGEEVLKQVKQDSLEMVDFLNMAVGDKIDIVYLGTVTSSELCLDYILKANFDKECVGIITWMHTFSPAKMWIRGLKKLQKPMLHLHTQFNQRLPYDSIDMDFMNLNQSAHGDRELGFIAARLKIKQHVLAGYYKNEDFINGLKTFGDVCLGIKKAFNLRVAMFGSNMRDVAVTDGDRVQSEIDLGWNVNYYGIGDLVDLINEVREEEVEEQLKEYKNKYDICSDNLEAIRTQAIYEIALRKFVKRENVNAITDNFQDLHGLSALPGLAVQDLMLEDIAFGPEGDYKTPALVATLMEIARGRKGATGFIEDYTYDLLEGEEVELGSHMLEVPPSFAFSKPQIQVHPLGIGGKEDPARLVFDSIEGDGLQITLADMGTHFRLIAAKIKLVKQPKPMPKLPVARIMWKIIPDFKTGTSAWLYYGGGHHSVITTQLTLDDIRLFAKFTGLELCIIDENTKLSDFEK